MKIITLIAALVFVNFLNAQNIKFFDASFKAALLSHSPVIDTNSDGEISVTEALALTAMNISKKGVNSVDELHYFSNIISINCSFNNLSQLNITGNPKMFLVVASTNKIDSLDVSILNNLTSLDVSYNGMTKLILGQHPSLNNLYCNNNLLTSLDLSKLPVLRVFQGHNNQFKSLDFSASPNELMNLYLSDNQLEYLDVRANKRINKYQVWIKNNPLKMICVDSVHLAVSSFWDYPENTLISSTCDTNDVSYINFTDPKFKAALLVNTPIVDTNVDGEISISEALATTALMISKKEINSLADLHYFPNLSSLNCSMNNLSKLDLSANSKLNILNVFMNQIDSLDVSGIPNLGSLDATYNNMKSLVLGNHPYLRNLACNNNKLKEINLSKLPDLLVFHGDVNEFTSLDFSGSPSNLFQVYVSNNLLNKIDIRLNIRPGFKLYAPNNPNLKMICVNSTQLGSTSNWDYPANTVLSTTCDTSEFSYINFPDPLFKDYLINWATFTRVQGSTKSIHTIDDNLDGEISLSEAEDILMLHLGAYKTGFDTLNWFTDIKGIEGFKNLFSLAIFKAKVEHVEITQLKNLEVLTLVTNPISSLKIENLPKLKALSLFGNNLTQVNLTNLPSLENLGIQDNKLTNIDLSEFNKLIFLSAEKNKADKICISTSIYKTIDVVLDANAKLDTLCGQNPIPIKDKKVLAALLAHVPVIDLDGDSIINVEEALKVKILNISYFDLQNLDGFEVFKNITTLNVSGNALTKIDVTVFAYLKKLYAAKNYIEIFTYLTTNHIIGGRTQENEDNSTLEVIDLSNNNLSELDVSPIVNLDSLNVSANSNLDLVCLNSNQLSNKTSTWTKDISTNWSNQNCLRSTSTINLKTSFQPAYPNPAENQIFVSEGVQGIYCISGSLAQVVNDNSLTINLNLSPGLYYIQYKSGKTEKLIVK